MYMLLISLLCHIQCQYIELKRSTPPPGWTTSTRRTRPWCSGLWWRALWLRQTAGLYWSQANRWNPAPGQSRLMCLVSLLPWLGHCGWVPGKGDDVSLIIWRSFSQIFSVFFSIFFYYFRFYGSWSFNFDLHLKFLYSIFNIRKIFLLWADCIDFLMASPIGRCAIPELKTRRPVWSGATAVAAYFCTAAADNSLPSCLVTRGYRAREFGMLKLSLSMRSS